MTCPVVRLASRLLLGGALLAGGAAAAPVAAQSSCDPSYPDVCIPPIREVGDLDCSQIGVGNFIVLAPDPRNFDTDYDGIGCEGYGLGISDSPNTRETVVPKAVAKPDGKGAEREPTATSPPDEVQPSGTPLPVSTPMLLVAPTTVPPTSLPTVASQAPVIAQGFVESTIDEVAWRVVRYTADTRTNAPFREYPPCFVLPIDGSLMLLDQASGEPTFLAPGTAAFVRPRAMQQRTSQSDELVHYLGIELVSTAEADGAPNGDVLYVSEPFVPSSGRHLLVLERHLLAPGQVLSVPDTGARNLLWVLEGVVISQPPNGQASATLAANEGTGVRGMWEISPAEFEQGETSGIDRATVVVASIESYTAPSAQPATKTTTEP